MVPASTTPFFPVTVVWVYSYSCCKIEVEPQGCGGSQLHRFPQGLASSCRAAFLWPWGWVSALWMAAEGTQSGLESLKEYVGPQGV